MAKVGMRHRENFNEIIGNLSRDAVQLTHPNRMAILAMNNKIFSDGLENHLESQQPTQNPTQQVYNPPPPQTAPYVPAGAASAAASAAAPADGPPSWMQAGARMGLGALTGLAKTGVAAAKVNTCFISSARGCQEAARQPRRLQSGTTILICTLMVVIFVQLQEGVIPWQLKMHSNFTRCSMQNHDQDMADAAAKRQRDAIAMVENTHQRNPFDDGGATLALMGRDTTASAAQIMQFAIEDQRPTFQHDGMDLITTIIPKLELDGTSHTDITPSALSLIVGQTSVKPLDRMIAHIAKRARVQSSEGPSKPSSPLNDAVEDQHSARRWGYRTEPQLNRNQSRRKSYKDAPQTSRIPTSKQKTRKKPGGTSDEKSRATSMRQSKSRGWNAALPTRRNQSVRTVFGGPGN